MGFRRVALILAFSISFSIGAAHAQQSGKGGITSIQQEPLKEWLTYIASDELQGRATYSEGLGLAAGYISSHLAQWGVKPAGDRGTYLQVVKVLGVRTTSRATVTVEVNGQTRTFNDGDGITFPKEMGGKQTVVADRVQFAGYGLTLLSGTHDDYAKLDPGGKVPGGTVVVWLGAAGPKSSESGLARLLSPYARNRAAISNGAVATIAPPGLGFGGRRTAPAAGSTPATPTTPPAVGSGRGRGGAVDNGDFTTVERFDGKVPPAVTAEDGFFEFLFSGSPVKYAELKEKAAKQEPLPPLLLAGVKITFNVDADYTIVRTRLTHNVVGIVEGSDPKLRDTYVAYGAHYDHTGYREGGVNAGRGGQPANPEDRIYNGADDDGSGTVAIMAIARAFALGPRPKRSLLFVWHTGEEAGLLGSLYNADHPVVPIDKIVTQLNMDMVGRNRNDDPRQSNTVFVVGSDRISTELHNINEDANASLPRPMSMDYEMNDPADTESIYTRSDHYSYAAKGIPIIFYFTGLHPDYHSVSDSVDKIIFDKVQRVAQLAYETGRRVANLDHAPVRDNKGPRVGKTVTGKLK